MNSEFCADGAGSVLAYVRQESPPRTYVFVGLEQGPFTQVDTPGLVTCAAGGGGRLAFGTEDGALYESANGGHSFAELAAPVQPWFGPISFAGARLWAGDRDRVLVRDGEHLTVRWSLPPGGHGRISALYPTGDDDGLVLTDQTRVFRARAGAAQLEDFSAGLPPPPGPGARQTATVALLDGIYLAFVGDLFLRSANDPAWRPAADGPPPALSGVVASQSAAWVTAPWAADRWVGSNGMFLLASGPGGALSERWRPPAPGGHYLNHLAAGAHMVFASLLRCTDALCGLRVRPDGSVDAIALPIK